VVSVVSSSSNSQEREKKEEIEEKAIGKKSFTPNPPHPPPQPALDLSYSSPLATSDDPHWGPPPDDLSDLPF